MTPARPAPELVCAAPPLLSVCYVFYVCPSVLSCFFLFVFIHVYMFVLNCCMCTGFLVEAGVLPFPLLVLQRSFLQAPCLPARDRHDLPCPLEDYVAPSSLLEITSFIHSSVTGESLPSLCKRPLLYAQFPVGLVSAGQVSV